MELRAPNNNGGNPTPDPESLHDDKAQQHTHEAHLTSYFDEIDSTCSTPYVSAPSSPGRGSGAGNSGFYYSAPASPMHFALTSSYTVMSPDNAGGVGLGFEFGSGSGATGSSMMSSADELFLNGKIRPMKLSTHLERPQVLSPLLDLEQEEEEEEESEGLVSRGRDLRVSRDKSMRSSRRTRSLSPLRSTFSKWNNNHEKVEEVVVVDKEKQKQQQSSHKSASQNEEVHELPEAEAASLSASSSRSSSAGRSTSKRWVFLKDFLRSKSEGRSNNKYFWLPTKEKKQQQQPTITKDQISSSSSISNSLSSSSSSSDNNGNKQKVKKPVNGIAAGGVKRRVPPPSPHELHYTANRAQHEEMKKKTFLPYKQGLLGCLGFSSKGYGAMNGIARALNPVSSR
ncbi:hypothetical protein ACOSP7_008838 [Xanthoceras sorbifolium]